MKSYMIQECLKSRRNTFDIKIGWTHSFWVNGKKKSWDKIILKTIAYIIRILVHWARYIINSGNNSIFLMAGISFWNVFVCVLPQELLLRWAAAFLSCPSLPKLNTEWTEPGWSLLSVWAAQTKTDTSTISTTISCRPKHVASSWLCSNDLNEACLKWWSLRPQLPWRKCKFSNIFAAHFK